MLSRLQANRGHLAAGAIIAALLVLVGWYYPAHAGTICDPNNATQCAKVDNTGALKTGAGGTFSSAAVGVNGAAGPLSSDQIGTPDASGNLQPVTPTNPLNVIAAPATAAGSGIAPIVSAAAESSHVIKNAAGLFYDAYVTTGATAGYFMAFNATSAPVDGAVTPAACVQAPANQTISLGVYGAPPVVYTTGVVLVFSTTGCFTKTASATAFFSGRVK